MNDLLNVRTMLFTPGNRPERFAVLMLKRFVLAVEI
jgi:hypothetical protein